MNWNPTENYFSTTYHSSFMVHCGPPVALLIPRLIVPPSLPDSLPPSLSLSLRVAAIPHRSSRCATANSHLPKRVCYVQVHGNVVSGNQIQVLREKVKRQERGTYVAFFPSPCLVLFGQRKKRRFVHGRHGFFGLLLLWAFR
jgi:hypothetical protein